MMANMTLEDVQNTFTYHPPTGTQTKRYEGLRIAAARVARAFMQDCPESAERTLAIRALQQAVMWANASIAINEVPATPEKTAPDPLAPQPLPDITAREQAYAEYDITRKKVAERAGPVYEKLVFASSEPPFVAFAHALANIEARIARLERA